MIFIPLKEQPADVAKNNNLQPADVAKNNKQRIFLIGRYADASQPCPHQLVLSQYISSCLV